MIDRLRRALPFLVPALLFPGEALADPQANVGLTLGMAGRALDRQIWDSTQFHMGIHGDIIFGRTSNKSFGVGPYVEFLSNGFDELQFGGGGSVVLPVIDSIPIVVSAGPYARLGREGFGLEPGLAGSLFFGSKSYNFSSNYVITAGLISEFRLGFGPSKETSIVLGVQLDFGLLALPAVYILDASQGGSHEIDKVKKPAKTEPPRATMEEK